MNYETKTPQYFAGSREDFLAFLPQNPQARILEAGCGFGETGRRALELGKCGTYVGIEISPKAAEIAAKNISQVLAGNVETMALPFEAGSFDALLISEVLEHLVDPWATLKRLAPLLREGAKVMASSPNVSHYRIILSLLRGEWKLTDVGVMDRTHLRWFTPQSYREMFEAAGFTLTNVGPIAPLAGKARLFDALTFGKCQHLLMRQIKVAGVKGPRT